MVQTTPVPDGGPAPPPARVMDNRVRFHDVSWERLEHILDARGDKSGVRIAYLCGELELMAPSIDHEQIKTTLARLIEAFAEDLGIDLNGVGSWTIKRREAERAAEPDECYVVGSVKGRDRPDLAIEVVSTSGGIDKLAVYAGLGVREVWIWQEGSIRAFVLAGDRYELADKSELLPGLDLDLVARLATAESQGAAVRELRRAGGEAT